MDDERASFQGLEALKPGVKRLLCFSLSSATQRAAMQQSLARALPRALAWHWAAAPQAAAAFSTAACGSDAEIKWVFLGPPGVGKGTYSTRIAQHLGVPHIAAGDLVRAEIKSGSPLGQQVSPKSGWAA